MAIPYNKEKYCPGCNNVFECKAGTIADCQCSSIKMNEQERSFLAQHYQDCLCAAACLLKMKAAYRNEAL